MAKLIKVAKHFNIGTSTVVEFLNSKGFDIESKPTAKVTDEMYELLENAYSGSAEVKEEADKLTMGNKPEKVEVKTPAPAPTPTPAPTPVEPEVIEVVKEEVSTPQAEVEVAKKEEIPIEPDVKEVVEKVAAKV